MATENDKVILDLKKEIESKKSLLASGVKFNPVTNCSLEIDGVRHNLHVVGKDVILFLIAKVNSLKMALAVSMPSETLTISGYTADQWLEDLVSKFNYLNVANEKARLVVLENKLHELLSTETKVKLELEDLKSQI